MALKTSECRFISNKSREYTDCMEFSLLRFLQLLGYDEGQMINDRQSSYSENIKSICSNIDNDLLEFINKYPFIYSETQPYISKDGIQQRSDWAEFVSDRKFLDYYRNDNAELFTSIENIFQFFNGFFQLDLLLENNPQENFDKIASTFSNNNKNIIININKIESYSMNKCMLDILDMISRPDDEYIKFVDDDTLYEIKVSTSYIDMNIDKYDYKWILYEVYFNNNDNISNKFITGHSVIYNI
eukprot:gene14126-18954_t